MSAAGNDTIKQVNKRGAARLAAVQALYQMDLSDAVVSDVVAEYEHIRLGQEVDGDAYLEADVSWFRGVVAGVVKDQITLDPLIHEALPDDWPLSRIDTLLRSILRCGVFELSTRKDVPSRVVISEYIDIAKAFFEEDEPKLINGVLDRLARDLRPGEFNNEKAE